MSSAYFIHFLEVEKLNNYALLFIQRPLKDQQGPEQATTDLIEQMSSKDIATELTNYDWELFTAMHEVTLHIFGQNITFCKRI